MSGCARKQKIVCCMLKSCFEVRVNLCRTLLGYGSRETAALILRKLYCPLVHVFKISKTDFRLISELIVALTHLLVSGSGVAQLKVGVDWVRLFCHCLSALHSLKKQKLDSAARVSLKERLSVLVIAAYSPSA